MPFIAMLMFGVCVAVQSAICLQHNAIEYRSDDVIKMKFVKLWDLLRYSDRTTSKTPTRQKLAIRAKLSLRN